MALKLFPGPAMPPPDSEDGSHIVQSKDTFQRLSLLSLIALTLFFLYLTYRMVQPFLPAIASAVALAVLLTPLHRKILAHVHKPGIAAFLSVIFAVVVIALPLSILGQQIVVQTGDATALVSRLLNTGGWKDLVPANGWLAEAVEWADRRFHLPNLADQISGWLGTHLPGIVQGSGQQLIATIITLYLLFYMMRDRHAALAILATISPFSRREMAALYVRIAQTIRATLFGTVTVAMVQGMLGGTMFWMLGLPAPLLWGVVMGVVAIVPVLGTFVVWAPAVIILLSTGQTGKAFILLGWSLLIVSTVDNLLYPVLVGNRLRMHTIPTFISLVGGLFVFGAAGLILGPVVLTITVFLLEYWRNESEAESLSDPSVPDRDGT